MPVQQSELYVKPRDDWLSYRTPQVSVPDMLQIRVAGRERAVTGLCRCASRMCFGHGSAMGTGASAGHSTGRPQGAFLLQPTWLNTQTWGSSCRRRLGGLGDGAGEKGHDHDSSQWSVSLGAYNTTQSQVGTRMPMRSPIAGVDAVHAEKRRGLFPAVAVELMCYSQWPSLLISVEREKPTLISMSLAGTLKTSWYKRSWK